MSPVNGLARLPQRILLFVHMGNFSPDDRDAIKETQPKSFGAVVALWTLEILLIKANRILLIKWKYIQDKNYAIFAAMFRK